MKVTILTLDSDIEEIRRDALCQTLIETPFGLCFIKVVHVSVGPEYRDSHLPDSHLTKDSVFVTSHPDKPHQTIGNQSNCRSSNLFKWRVIHENLR
jgi:hypothetical protein